ncbi:MAG: hypothetical protein IJ083_09575, partial [Clostridia bacterium]|nr:hypothetical protein [Clostridia bacterium]
MKIDLSCPCEVWRCRLADEGHGAQVILNNLSNQHVVSTEVTLLITRPGQDQPERVLHREYDLRAKPGQSFTVLVPLPDADAEPSKVEVIIEKIWYDDATVWRRGRSPMTEFQSNRLPKGRDLDRLRFVAGPHAVGYPEEQAQVWMCMCGRPNALSSQTCAHCGNSREEIFRLYSRDAVDEVIRRHEERLRRQSREAIQESDSARGGQVQERIDRKKKRHPLRVLVAIIVAAAAVYGAWVYAVPFARYEYARYQLSQGQWDEAIASFTEMGDYLSARDELRRARYEKAKSQLDSRSESQLLDARDVFTQLGDYLDSRSMIHQADYMLASLYLTQGHTTEAEEIFLSLGNYQDSADMALLCVYTRADEQRAGGDLKTALETYQTLGDFRDSKAQVRACVLSGAEAALKAENVDEAISFLEILSDAESTDAAVLALSQQAHYLKGQQLYEEGLMAQAGAQFLLCGDYSDARDQAQLCIYTPAQALMDEGKYDEAMQLFASISGYLDADAKALQCIYLEAKA